MVSVTDIMMANTLLGLTEENTPVLHHARDNVPEEVAVEQFNTFQEIRDAGPSSMLESITATVSMEGEMDMVASASPETSGDLIACEVNGYS
jgi:hypothetical protein